MKLTEDQKQKVWRSIEGRQCPYCLNSFAHDARLGNYLRRLPSFDPAETNEEPDVVAVITCGCGFVTLLSPPSELKE